jgi:hypothetical protein
VQGIQIIRKAREGFVTYRKQSAAGTKDAAMPYGFLFTASAGALGMPRSEVNHADAPPISTGFCAIGAVALELLSAVFRTSKSPVEAKSVELLHTLCNIG